MKRYVGALLMGLLLLTNCSNEEVDFNNPDAKVFVKQIKSGDYHTKSPNGFVEVPNFAKKDIPELIKHVKEIRTIPYFPSNRLSSYGLYADFRLGECMMWTIEYIRVGRYSSFGYKLIHKNRNEHLQYAFVTDEEMKVAADLYIKWWEKVMNQPAYILKDSFTENPLKGSNFKWN